MSDAEEIAREIVMDWLGLTNPPIQVRFEQSEYLQQAIASAIRKIESDRDRLAKEVERLREALADMEHFVVEADMRAEVRRDLRKRIRARMAACLTPSTPEGGGE